MMKWLRRPLDAWSMALLALLALPFAVGGGALLYWEDALDIWTSRHFERPWPFDAQALSCWAVLVSVVFAAYPLNFICRWFWRWLDRRVPWFTRAVRFLPYACRTGGFHASSAARTPEARARDALVLCLGGVVLAGMAGAAWVKCGPDDVAVDSELARAGLVLSVASGVLLLWALALARPWLWEKVVWALVRRMKLWLTDPGLDRPYVRQVATLVVLTACGFMALLGLWLFGELTGAYSLHIGEWAFDLGRRSNCTLLLWTTVVSGAALAWYYLDLLRHRFSLSQTALGVLAALWLPCVAVAGYYRGASGAAVVAFGLAPLLCCAASWAEAVAGLLGFASRLLRVSLVVLFCLIPLAMLACLVSAGVAFVFHQYKQPIPVSCWLVDAGAILVVAVPLVLSWRGRRIARRLVAAMAATQAAPNAPGSEVQVAATPGST